MVEGPQAGLEIADAPPGAVLSPSDFEVKMGTGGDPSTWAAAPTPTVGVRRGAGVGGSDRVTLTFPDNAIKNVWLQVTVRANSVAGSSPWGTFSALATAKS